MTHVTLDTGILRDTPGIYSISFNLINGDGAINTALIDNFNIGGGAFGAVYLSEAGVSGSAPTSIAITDANGLFTHEIDQYFTPSATPISTLSFDVTLSGNSDGGATPDTFSFTILTGLNGTGTISDDISGALFTADISSGGQTAFAAYSGLQGEFQSPAYVTAGATPEPGALGLAVGASLSGIAFSIRSRRRRSSLPASH